MPVSMGDIMGENMTVRLVREEEMEEVRRLSAICFDYPYRREEEEKVRSEGQDNKEKDKDSVRHNRQYGAFTEQNEMMASMVAIPLAFYYEGQAVSGYGIGNVCTYPHHRKKGAIRAMFEQMLADAYHAGCMLSYLYPFSESFYGKFGYCRMDHSLRYTLDLQGIPKKTWTGTFELYQEGAGEVFAACREAYDAFAVRYNLMVKRAEADWSILTDAKASLNNHYLYLYRDKNGEPSGYIVFWRKGEDLTCRELVFRDYETLGDILSFMKGYAADYRHICFHAPSILRLDSMCTDYSTYPAKIEKAMNGMVRVINVREALSCAAYRGGGRISIQIRDRLIAENNGVFIVEFADGKAQNVSVLPIAGEEQEPWDVAMDIAVFSAAIMGDYDTADFSYLPQVQVRDVAVCGQVFYRKPSFINNFF